MPYLKKTLFYSIVIAVGFLVAFAIMEIGASLYFFSKDKKLIPVSELLAKNDDYFRSHFDDRECSWNDRLQAHPYFGYVYRRQGRCAIKDVNSMGLRGPELPVKKDSSEHVVLLIGGSVAEAYALTGNLQNALNAEFTNGKIKHFRVIVGAAPAWKQPQQFILLTLLADKVDTVISLDGFNEHYAMAPGSYPFENPGVGYQRQVYSGGIRALKYAAGAFLNRKFYTLQRRNIFFSHSRFLYLLAEKIRQAGAKIYADGSFGRTVLLEDNMVPFHEDNLFYDKQNYSERNLQRYLHYVKTANIFSKAMRVPAFFFLQPVPTYKKALTAEEARRNYLKDYSALYRTLEQGFLGLKKEGVHVTSLAGIFENEKDDIYLDEVHVNERGNELIGKNLLLILRPYFQSLSK